MIWHDAREEYFALGYKMRYDYEVARRMPIQQRKWMMARLMKQLEAEAIKTKSK